MKHNSAYFDTNFENLYTFESSLSGDSVYTFDSGMQELTTIYSKDHSVLTNRDKPDQHPMNAITGLVDALNAKQNTLSAGLGIVIQDNIIELDDLILNCGTSTTVI